MGHSSSRDGWEPTQWIMDTSKFTHILSHPANFCLLKQRQVKIKFYQKHITPNGLYASGFIQFSTKFTKKKTLININFLLTFVSMVEGGVEHETCMVLAGVQ